MVRLFQQVIFLLKIVPWSVGFALVGALIVTFVSVKAHATLVMTSPVHIAAAIAETSLFTFICVPPRVVVVCPRESTGDREARFLTALRPGQTKVRPFLSVSKRGPPLPALGLGEPAIVAGGRARKRPLVALAAGPARLIPANLNLGWVIKRERLASRNRHRAPGGRVVVDGAHPPR